MSGDMLMIPKIRKVLLLALWLVSVAGASPPPAEIKPKPAPTPEQAAKIAKSQADPARPAKTLEWHDRYEMPWAIDLQQLEFRDAELKDSLLLFDKLARGLAEAGKWKKPAPAAYPYLSWNGGSDGFSRHYQGRWESGDADQHLLFVELVLHDKRRVIDYYNVSAMRKPANDWGVSWRMHLSKYRGGNSVGFNLSVTHPTLLPGDPVTRQAKGLNLTVGQQVFESSISGVRNSSLRVSSGGNKPIYELEQMQRTNLPLLWKSAESFRETVLQDFDAFEANVRQWEADGGLVARWEGGTSGGDPPRETPYKIKIPEGQRNELVKAALQQSAERRKLIETHYREMYAALLKSFPDFLKLLPYYAPAKESAVP